MIKENKIWRQSIPQLLGVTATAKRMFSSTGVPVLMAFPRLHPPQDHQPTVPGASQMLLTLRAGGQRCT